MLVYTSLDYELNTHVRIHRETKKMTSQIK